MGHLQLGMHLSGVGSNSFPSLPFLNLVRMGMLWTGNKSGGGGTLNSNIDGYGHFDIDATGHIKSMNDPTGGTFDELWFTLFDDGSTNYAGQRSPQVGTYILLHDGGAPTTTWAWNFTDFTFKSGGYTGGGVNKTRIVLDLTSAHSVGLSRFKLTAINAASYPFNIKLVYEPNWTFTQAAGAAYDPTGSQPSYVGPREWALMHDKEIFNPDHTEMLKPSSAPIPFAPIRFMDWQFENGNTATSFANINPVDWIFWNDATFGGGATHVPYEVQVALCNKIGVDGWFYIPICADDSFTTDIANRIKNGSSGVPDAFGVTWAGLDGSMLAYMEHGNEMWNDGLHGPLTNFVWRYGAQVCASVFPDKASEIGKFTGYIDNNSTPGTYSGVSGTVLTVTAMTSGQINDEAHAGDPNNIITDYPGHTITDYTRVTNRISGTGQAGTYSVSNSQAVPSTTIRQGFVNNMSKCQQNYQGVRDAWIWRSILGSQARCVRGCQMGGIVGTDLMDALPSNHGSGLSTWDGVHGGTTASNYEFVAVAPYIDFNASLPPAAWSDTVVADPNFQKFRQEMISGGVLPISSAFVTATDLGGGALAGGWTQCKVTSGQGLSNPPPNGSIVCTKFTASSGSNPTISVDGGTQLPIQNNVYGTSEGVGVQTVNLIYTGVIMGQNPVPTPGWRKFNLGLTNSGHPGFIGLAAYAQMQNNFNQTAGLNNVNSVRIPIVLYEGGPSLYAPDNSTKPWIAYLKILSESQAMGDVVAEYLSQLNAAGYVTGNMFPWFGSADFYASTNGNFPGKEFVYDPPSGSPKYMAMLDYLGAAGDGGGSTGTGTQTISHGSGKHVGRPTKIPHV